MYTEGVSGRLEAYGQGDFHASLSALVDIGSAYSDCRGRDGDPPNGDIVGGAMTEVVENGTAHLSRDDLRAIAVYPMALPVDEGP